MPTYLEDALVDFHECNRLAYTHPLTVTKGEFYIALHLFSTWAIKLREALGAENIGIGPEEVFRSEDGGHVHTNCSALGNVVAKNILASLGDDFGEEADERWSHAKALVHDSLVQKIRCELATWSDFKSSPVGTEVSLPPRN